MSFARVWEPNGDVSCALARVGPIPWRVGWHQQFAFPYAELI